MYIYIYIYTHTYLRELQCLRRVLDEESVLHISGRMRLYNNKSLRNDQFLSERSDATKRRNTQRCERKCDTVGQCQKYGEKRKKTTTYIHIYIYMCVCVCVCVCTHTYIHICTHIPEAETKSRSSRKTSRRICREKRVCTHKVNKRIKHLCVCIQDLSTSVCACFRKKSQRMCMEKRVCIIR
jgi:hypothetical protein